MPHQCTTCGRTFPDGSKEMLSGCPDCGGNKFQFKPASETTDEQPSPGGSQSSSADRRPATDSRPAAGDDDATAADDASTPDSQQPESRSPDAGSRTPDAESRTSDAESRTPDDQVADANRSDSEHVRERTEEDVAQASARSDVVSPDELDRASRDVETDSPATEPGPDTPTDTEGPRPDIDDLRDELNEQFESIRIVSPGKYELNLMELYDRQEYIISLQEDGRYVIEMPDAWGISDE
ncbi:OapC/ArvC family zinc-ribbon domain-containing protein [Halorubrum halophilum]|uniref:OapC/ArvC family zinc-ribbon domain-containing protein n=1 Tax=Halorubrum halophilum TaxID=413816 RepID=UPI0006786A43|nr:Zn-ribbon containing protein [Halorubrum halophilum]